MSENDSSSVNNDNTTGFTIGESFRSSLPTTSLTTKPQSKKISLIKERENRNKAFAEVRDVPTNQDRLGFNRWAVYVTEFIGRDFRRDFTEATQVTIGVYGEWGSGKTSFLRMVERDLKKIDISPIWFDAWKYDKEDNLWAALLQKILDDAKVRGNWLRKVWVRFLIWKDSIRFRVGMWEVIKNLFPAILRLIVFIAGLVILLGLDKNTIGTLFSKWLPGYSLLPIYWQNIIIKALGAVIATGAGATLSLISLFKGKLGIDFSKFSHKPSYREHIAFLDEFSKEFKKIVRLVGQGKPLVVIIDDLDRCLPEKAIQVIEAIKAFLDVEGCVFLLGLDREIVGRAVAAKYKDLFLLDEDKNVPFHKRKTFYEDYMDKIIQLAISLPQLDQSKVKDFVKSLSSNEDIIQCARIFGAGLPPNPRKIKQILRTFLFIRDIMIEDIKAGRIKISILAKIVVIQSQLPAVFKVFIAKPSLLQELEKIYRAKDKEVIQQSIPPEEDKLIWEQAEIFAIDYPQLPQILLTQIDEADTFINADLSTYIALVGVLDVVRPISEKIVMMDELADQMRAREVRSDLDSFTEQAGFRTGSWRTLTSLRTKKEISYQVISDEPIINISNEMKDRVSVHFGERKVEDMRLVSIRVWNSGRSPVSPEDYDMPITLTFEGRTLIDAHVLIDTITIDDDQLKLDVVSLKLPLASLTPRVLFEKEHPNIIRLSPILFNPKDSITLQALLEGLPGRISVEARIMGAKLVQNRV